MRYYFYDVEYCPKWEIRENNALECGHRLLKKIKSGNYDNVGECQYAIPSHWDMGKVYKRFFTDMQWKLIKFSAIIE